MSARSAAARHWLSRFNGDVEEQPCTARPPCSFWISIPKIREHKTKEIRDATANTCNYLHYDEVGKYGWCGDLKLSLKNPAHGIALWHYGKVATQLISTRTFDLRLSRSAATACLWLPLCRDFAANIIIRQWGNVVDVVYAVRQVGWRFGIYGRPNIPASSVSFLSRIKVVWNVCGFAHNNACGIWCIVFV